MNKLFNIEKYTGNIYEYRERTGHWGSAGLNPHLLFGEQSIVLVEFFDENDIALFVNGKHVLSYFAEDDEEVFTMFVKAVEVISEILSTNCTILRINLNWDGKEEECDAFMESWDWDLLIYEAFFKGRT